jgi:signal transduction histidine kinase
MPDAGPAAIEVELLARLAHDLRSPLAAIRSSAWLLGRARGRRARAAVVAGIESEVDRAAALLDDLQALGRGGRALGLAASEVDCGELVAAVADSRRPLAAERRLLLAVEAERPALALADPRRLQELVANLLDNALDHARTRVAVHVSAGARSVAIEVVDDGPGIAGEHVPELFRAGWQGPGRSAGSGLGLAIARELAEAHGGTLRVASGGLGGASFVAELPRRGAVDGAAWALERSSS